VVEHATTVVREPEERDSRSLLFQLDTQIQLKHNILNAEYEHSEFLQIPMMTGHQHINSDLPRTSKNAPLATE